MKLPLERIYLFPELKFGVYKDREDLENILNNIFYFYELDGRDIIDFLEKNFTAETKKKTIKILNETKVKPYEELFFKDENEIGGYIAYYLETHPSEELKLVTKSKFIPKELKDKFLEKFESQGLQVKGEDIDKFLEENKK